MPIYAWWSLPCNSQIEIKKDSGNGRIGEDLVKQSCMSKLSCFESFLRGALPVSMESDTLIDDQLAPSWVR